MNGIILISVCLVLGKILGNMVPSRESFIYSLNAVAIRVALPALVMDKIHAQTISANAILPILSPWVCFILTIAIVYLIRLWIPLSRVTIGCLILLAGTANTSFVGVPLIQALMGTNEYIGVALWVDQSNFVLLFTAGIFVADFYTGHATSMKKALSNLIRYTPIQALVLALILKPISFPESFQFLLTTFGGLVTPLTMISVGASLHLPKNSRLIANLSIGLAIKLLMVPCVIYLLITYVIRTDVPEINQVIIMQAGMAPMVIATIIAQEKNLHPQLASLLTAIGIPLSFITVSFWYWLSITA